MDYKDAWDELAGRIAKIQSDYAEADPKCKNDYISGCIDACERILVIMSVMDFRINHSHHTEEEDDIEF